MASFNTIQSGDPCVVHFSDTTPDITGTFQRFITDGGTAVITTPQGETDPALQSVYYIDDYQYILKNVIPPPTTTVDPNVGDSVEVRFANVGMNQTLIGTVVAFDPVQALIAIDDGANIIVAKDYWSITLL